jgi:hypothetical protein
MLFFLIQLFNCASIEVQVYALSSLELHADGIVVVLRRHLLEALDLWTLVRGALLAHSAGVASHAKMDKWTVRILRHYEAIKNRLGNSFTIFSNFTTALNYKLKNQRSGKSTNSLQRSTAATEANFSLLSHPTSPKLCPPNRYLEHLIPVVSENVE